MLLTQDFGVRNDQPLPFLVGSVFRDTDHDGFYSMGEGLGSVTITVLQGTTQVAQTTTTAAGGYQLPLAPGTYTVRASGAGATFADQTVTVGSVNVHRNFLAQDAAQPAPPTAALMTAASAVSPDTTYVVATNGALWQHVGTNQSTGWSLMLASGVTDVSVGTDAAGKDAVFVRQGTALYEHTGADPSGGWVQIYASGVTQISASRVQADTVFANFNGDLWEHVGQNSGSWIHVWNTGVTGISAGVDSAGKPAVFANFSGTLWEHTGTDMNSGWSFVGNGVTQFSASESQADTAFALLGNLLREHVGRDPNANWFALI
jgi:hypothetical protein